MKKARKLLICRAFKAGLSIAQVAWVFNVSEDKVHQVLREML